MERTPTNHDPVGVDEVRVAQALRFENDMPPALRVAFVVDRALTATDADRRRLLEGV